MHVFYRVMKGIYVCCKFTQLHSRQILLKSVNIWLSYCEKQKGELFFETQCIIKRGSSQCHLLGKWKLTSTAFVLSYCGLKAMTLELWGQQNQSLGNKCDKPNLTKNLVHMHRSRGDNVQEIFGAIGQMGQNWGFRFFVTFFVWYTRSYFVNFSPTDFLQIRLWQANPYPL